jgi:hypothetical protein
VVLRRRCSLAKVCAVLAVVLGLCPSCRAQKQPGVIGVLRPALHTGFEQAMKRIPAQYRAMMQASMGKLQVFYTTQAPLIVQNTWVEVLERNGFTAVALDAATPEEAIAETKAKDVRWLLSSSVDAVPEQAAHRPQPPRSEVWTENSKIDVRLDLQFSLNDDQGHNVFPLQHESFDGVVNARGRGDDLWADAGNAISKRVGAALPLGARRQAPETFLRPAPPEMTESVRFDITVSKMRTYNGKAVPGPYADSRHAILAFAGGAVSTEDRETGVVYLPGASRFFVLDDRSHTYSTMTAMDLLYMRSLEQMARQGGASQAKLVQTGAEGRAIRYRLQRAEAMPTPEQQQANAIAEMNIPGRFKRRIEQSAATQETQIDVEYGDPSKAWQQGMATSMDVFSKAGGWFIDLVEDQQIADAIWLELAGNPSPPLRISVHDAVTSEYKKKGTSMVEEAQVTFTTPQLARPVDFTVPGDYKWHSNPVLTGLLLSSNAPL